ncbi:MAG: type VII secretion protein EccB [Mycobacterium pseudokansasii]|uniref:ESX-3 secretion system ATPase EccB3 n=1 Tax=Mycobacterium pseudokansasii TaxID=2341080 RepID=A0A498QM28_9MYCO|nr:type VII secretion protein EccB [Mycobacterium pseudokansasii]KZS64982.1 type VII secretion protein EccB [Mycobacterium kansasii]MBY0387579.1 type VII secretion protein EccB [Mycobacterium pseudokansasii]VAZ90118.1 ESX-3 secretion system ATPase EccB3 [Mycobacterium pseudokansasii]VAZ90898.1 ESX-3 secretion system ATPase EccB3 [Mycobacterium pseudokansasii]VBA48035.1 ESX-3 secretion system ATPase EccB3 [Mycobacterium pseudokansasii]
MPGQSSAGRHVNAYRFLLRRLECVLLHRDGDRALRAPTLGLAVGCVLATVAAAVCAMGAVVRPQPGLGDARIVMGRDTGALYVRVGDTWHPVLNLASARLIAASDANPRRVRESELRHTKRGPLLGIPGAPQLIGPWLAAAESRWTVCDTDREAATTVLVGPVDETSVRRLTAEQTLLVTVGSGAPAYLLYHGRRAVVDLADSAVLRALRLEGRTPRVVSQSLLSAVPEAPSITTPPISHAGEPSAAGVPGFPVGTVLRITRDENEEFYVVLKTGVQRIGRVAADLLRFSDSHGNIHIVAVAPDAIRSAPIANILPVSTFPDEVATPRDDSDTTLCVTWLAAQSGRPDLAFLTGGGLPLPSATVPVTLAQADGRGPALDAVYLPPGRSAYAAVRSLSGAETRTVWRYLVTDTGVRFAIRDDDAARHLGLPAPVPAPWPILAALPQGPELGRQQASVAHDTVAAGPS